MIKNISLKIMRFVRHWGGYLLAAIPFFFALSNFYQHITSSWFHVKGWLPFLWFFPIAPRAILLNWVPYWLLFAALTICYLLGVFYNKKVPGGYVWLAGWWLLTLLFQFQPVY